MGMKGGEVVAALPTQERQISFCIVTLFHRSEGAIGVLHVGGCHHHAFYLFNKVRIIPTAWTTDPAQRFLER